MIEAFLKTLPRAIAGGIFFLTALPALAQQPVRIWDIPFGTPTSALPADEFVDPACGSNGGPAGVPLASFTEYAKCAPEPSGLREVWFIYDDTQEYVALALRNPVLLGRYRATAIAQQPVVLSLLIDEQARVAGYRIFTDPRAEEAQRYEAHTVAANLRGRFGTAWTCTDLDAALGETPIAGTFVKQSCLHEEAGLRARVESRFYYRPGQQMIDPNTGQPMVNAFESRAWIEVLAVGPLPEVPRPPSAGRAVVTRDLLLRRGEVPFLNGETKNCPGCDLQDADLRRRDLSGANLEGANLEGAILHRANLRNANLYGANLSGANLNRADLTLANLSASTLREAMLWQADASRANFEDADVSYALLGKIRATLANFRSADVTRTDLGEARLNDADFTLATLDDCFLYQAVLIRANLTRAFVQRAVMGEASLHDATLTGASLRESDLLGADLSGANLTNADFSGTRLLNANLTGAVQTGMKVTGALLPDNTTGK